MRRIFWIALASIILLAVAAFGQAENPNTDHGFSPEKVYQFGEIDGINLFNGNLNVMLPIGQTYPVGGKLSYGLTLAYGGNNWLTGATLYAQSGEPEGQPRSPKG